MQCLTVNPLKMIKLSVIIPVFNEVETVKEIIDQVKAVKIENLEKELIVIDDCSSDGTRKVLKGINGIKLLSHKSNMGKGVAIRTGLNHADGDIIIIQDADLEYDPTDYPQLIKPILSGSTKVVFGSRFIKPGFKPRNRVVYLGNKFLSLLTMLLYFRKVTDMETCYKVFTRDVLLNINLKAKGFEFEPEITAKIIKKGYNILEVPIKYRGRSTKEGKKLKPIQDGIKAVYYLLKYRFFH